MQGVMNSPASMRLAQRGVVHVRVVLEVRGRPPGYVTRFAPTRAFLHVVCDQRPDPRLEEASAAHDLLALLLVLCVSTARILR